MRVEGRLCPAEQEKRERLRLEAAARFARGDEATVLAADLRVTERTVRRWRKVWREGGPAAPSTTVPWLCRTSCSPAGG
ncbi:helix-turn-helix domain-containing protein [Streptomyces sp. NPDC048636]|uniref:helix-turn-helix domain-containing protein n=1 Tax=Streptomyces sp. NPDC048636 TaxID=3155762 RepID=UPI00341B8179